MNKFVTTPEQHKRNKAAYNLKWGFPHHKSAIHPDYLNQWIAHNGPYLYHGTTEDAANQIAQEGLYPHNRLPSHGNDTDVVCDHCGVASPEGETKCAGCGNPFSGYEVTKPSQGRANYDNYFRTRDDHVYMGTQPFVRTGHIKGGLVGIDLRKLDPALINPDEDHFVAGGSAFNSQHPVIDKIYNDDPPPTPTEYQESEDGAESLGDWASRVNLGSEPGESEYSLDKGSLSYNGRIPPEALHVVGTGYYDGYQPRGQSWLPEGWQQDQQIVNPSSLPSTFSAVEPDELHVSLDVPQYTAKAIYRWARDQDWPEETELEQPREYHCTLLYSKTGSHWRYNPWWVEKLEQGKAHIKGFESFGPNSEGKYAYVLELDSPEIQEVGQKMTDKGGQMGLDINFPEYKPHITIGYGPTKVTGFDAPNMEIDLGPSSISEPRTASAIDEPFQPDPTAQALDHLSLASVAHNLHYGFENGRVTDPATAVDYANRLLKMIGYPPDEMTTQAAIQAWQQMYPQDRLLPPASEPQQIQAAFNSTMQWTPGSWGRGFIGPDNNLHTWNATTLSSGGVPHHRDRASELGFDTYSNPIIIGPNGWYTHNTPDVNQDVTRSAQAGGMRYTPDFDRWSLRTSHIDNDYDNVWHTSGKFFRLPEYRPDWPPPGGTHACPTCGLGLISHGMYGWSDASQPAPANMSWYCPDCQTNFDPVVTRPMPHAAYTESQVLWIPAEKEEEPVWKKKNVDPSLETDWRAMSEDEKHHNDVSFSNDTKNLA